MQIIKIVILYLLLLTSIYSQDSVKWSSYQGKMKWIEAKNLCESMKMRLPTISELQMAIKPDTTKGWRKNGNLYWAINKNLGKSNSTYKAIYLFGETQGEVENHRAESQLGVFCANVTEESAELDVIRELVENKATEREIQKAREDLGAKKFSEYQGKLSWDDANKNCELLKMRLPTITELKEAYDSGITNSWQKDGYRYWSATPYGAVRYYLFDVFDGYTDYYARDGNGYVRCRR
jgi:hypothetical protein